MLNKLLHPIWERFYRLEPEPEFEDPQSLTACIFEQIHRGAVTPGVSIKEIKITQSEARRLMLENKNTRVDLFTEGRTSLFGVPVRVVGNGEHSTEL